MLGTAGSGVYNKLVYAYIRMPTVADALNVVNGLKKKDYQRGRTIKFSFGNKLENEKPRDSSSGDRSKSPAARESRSPIKSR